MNLDKKVLYICPNGYMGGAERFVVDAAFAHKKYGSWHPSILFFSSGDAVTAAEKRGIDFLVLPFSFRLSRPVSLWKATVFIHRFARQHNFDVVHGTMPYGYIMAWLGTLFLPIRRVWYQHGPVGGILDKIACWLFPHRLLYNSTFLREKHEAYDWQNRGRQIHHIVPCAISEEEPNQERVEAIRQQYLQPGQVLVLLAGRISRCKGYDTYFRAISKICSPREGSPADVLMTIVVGDATMPEDKIYFEELKDLVNDLHLENRIQFVGRQSDMANYFRAADLFIHCSNVPEPFGLVVGEAMIQDTFVIGSSAGGIKEMLMNGKTGWSYDATSHNAVEQLAHLMVKIPDVIHSEPISRLKKAGRDLVKKKFSQPRLVADLEMIYDSLLNRSEEPEKSAG